MWSHPKVCLRKAPLSSSLGWWAGFSSSRAVGLRDTDHPPQALAMRASPKWQFPSSKYASREGERMSENEVEVTVFCNLSTSCHFCCVVSVRRQSLDPSLTQKEGTKQGSESSERQGSSQKSAHLHTSLQLLLRLSRNSSRTTTTVGLLRYCCCPFSLLRLFCTPPPIRGSGEAALSRDSSKRDLVQ